MDKLCAVLVALLAAAGLGLSAGTAGAHIPEAAAGSYGWPVKPFDQPHPIRGGFGDPRTVFLGPPTKRTLMESGGSFQFHFGVDISAPDGTAVYPVESGTVSSVNFDWLAVDSGNGRSFQYWHIVSAVSVGEHVQADVTVLGHIIRGAGHVHLTELDGGYVVSPLQPGHLSPYVDHTTPRVAFVEFRDGPTGSDLMAGILRGRVEMIASAYDMPAMPVPGEWHDLPVTPAVVEWRIDSARTGRTIVPEHVVYDVHRSLPPNTDFWKVYARGTYQNMSVFGAHYSYMQPGAYLFRLTPGGFDTKELGDDVYDLVVTVSDTAGNQSSYVQRFSVHNRSGIVGV
jgi:hypothetical protein